MMLVLLFIGILLTLLFPILALPFNLIGLLISKGGIRKCYGILLAFSLAMVAFVWVPESEMDLYRHHQQLGTLTNFNISQLGNLIKTNLEPMQYIIKFAVAQTGNYNLLQFFVLLCGYSELFWLICDLVELKNIGKPTFLLLLVFVFSAVKFIDFASGLWCNFAIINIALGVYLYYFKGTKWLQYVFYILAACLHTGTIYVVLLTILLTKIKIFKKIKISTIILLFSLTLSFGLIIIMINNLFGTESVIVGMLNSMYNSYFVYGDRFEVLHTGWNLYLPLIVITISIMLAIWNYRRKDSLREYDSFVVYMTIVIIATIINAGVFVRYGFLLAILALPLMADYSTMVQSKKMKVAFITILLVLTSLQLYRSYVQMEMSELTKQIRDDVTSSVFYLMGTK